MAAFSVDSVLSKGISSINIVRLFGVLRTRRNLSVAKMKFEETKMTLRQF